MTDTFVRNRITDIERLQQSLADEVKDRDSKGPQRMELASKVIVYLEAARQLLIEDTSRA